MKKLLPFIIVGFFCVACDSARPVVQNTAPVQPGPANERPQTAIAHTTENQQPLSNPSGGPKTKWTQSGEAFDTSDLDKAISTAEKTLSSKPSDASAKKALSEAYYKRAVALTDKHQYASALGDYRRTLKYDPSNTDAKDWVDKIIMIYDSMNKESPNEGEEPPPLPFEKGK